MESRAPKALAEEEHPDVPLQDRGVVVLFVRQGAPAPLAAAEPGPSIHGRCGSRRLLTGGALRLHAPLAAMQRPQSCPR